MNDDQAHQLAIFGEDFLHDYFAFYPNIACMLGLHEYDGQIANLQRSAIDDWVKRLHRYRSRLSQIDPVYLDRLRAFDYDILHWQIDSEIWQWSERREFIHNPLVYADAIMFDNYVKRNYAPPEERARSLIRHLQQIPEVIAVARENLSNVSRILIEESKPVFEGVIAFIEKNPLVEFGKDHFSPSLWNELQIARDEATLALNSFIDYLAHALAPQATDDFAIGHLQFSNMLRYHELIDLPLGDILRVGEEDLAHNQAMLVEIAAQTDSNKTVQEHMVALGKNHPSADQLLVETQKLLGDLRTFLIEHDLVTVPEKAYCSVEETPPFARWAFAMLDTPGPFETEATEAFYYITLPEPSWSQEEVEGWMTKFDYATLTGVSIHEAYPGHLIHFTNIRNAPTKLCKVFDTYSHFESWAHYVEQMMLDEGYGDGNLALRMAQLGEALVRNCRYVCSIKMHTQEMSVDEATQFFMNHAYMDEVTARKEALRGTHDPGYINYTLGKLLLLKLRDDYQQSQGDQFSLKKFHNEYIGYGSPPIPLLRKLLVPENSGSLL